MIKGEGKDSKKKETFEDHLSKHIETPLSSKNNTKHYDSDDTDPN
ncbi:MAG: hypothetical protein ACM3TR_10740 [Caulobacteraceae bacterium]